MKFDPYRVYTIAQACSILDIHPITLQRKIRAGVLPAVKIGSRYIITGQSLLDYIGIENADVSAVKLETALVALDLGYNPNISELGNSPFYNLTAGVVSQIAKDAANRSELLSKIADFINETRMARLKPRVKMMAKDSMTGEYFTLCRIGHDADGHIIDLAVYNKDGSVTDRTNDPHIEIVPVLLN